MIQHPYLMMASIILLVILSYLEILYYRAGFPKTVSWLIVLFLCGAGAAVCGGLTLIPKPIVMFQSAGPCGVMLFAALGGASLQFIQLPKPRRKRRKTINDEINRIDAL